MSIESAKKNNSFQRENKTKVKFINLISLIILWIGVVLSFKVGYHTNSQVFAGIILLVICTFATFINYTVGAKWTLATVCLGVFGLVIFSPYSYGFSIGVAGLSVGFDAIPLLIGIIHYHTNKKVLYNVVGSFINRELSEEEMQSMKRTKINGFKSRFSNKSLEELENIFENKNLVPDAIIAAKELIEERKMGT